MTTDDAAELRQLRRCIRDLVALSSVRARWVGRPPALLAESLRDLLLSTIAADTVHVELRDRVTPATHVASGGSAQSGGREDAAAHVARCAVGIKGDLGAFTVGSSRADFPTTVESVLLQVIANEIAVTMQHEELLLRHEDTERLLSDRVSREAAVARLATRISTGLGVEELLGEAVRELREILHLDVCEIFELVAEGQPLVLRARDGDAVHAIDTARLGIDAAGSKSVFLGTDPVIAEDVGRDERFPRSLALTAQGVTGWVSVMVPGASRPYGMLGAQTRAARVFAVDDVRFLQSVANVLAVSLQRQAMEVERESLLQVTARARAQAERDSRAKSEFLGMMSHELRTPLNAIAGYAQLIEEGVHGPISDEQRTDLMRIQRSQRYLLGVIDNVLSFLKLGGGRVLYDLAEFDVADAIQSVDELVRPLIAAKGLRYERRLSPRSVLVRADRNKLQQILLNLLSNAVKFTDSGGTITIAWARESDEVRIRVEDTGWGIPAERLENVFEPFTQIDSTRSRAAGGTGLGLTISREFARGMGGNLSVKSEPAKGSVFTVALPVAGLGFDDRGPPSETG